jgi:hypothetical protein
MKYVTKFSPLLNVFEKIYPSTLIEPYLRTKFSKIHDRIWKSCVSQFNNMNKSTVALRRFKFAERRPTKTCKASLIQLKVNGTTVNGTTVNGTTVNGTTVNGLDFKRFVSARAREIKAET